MAFNFRRLIKKHSAVVLYFIVTGFNSLFIMIPGCVKKNSTHQTTFTVVGAQGIIAGQFIQPRAIASSVDSKLFVVDKTGRIQRFDSNGKFELSWEMPDNNPNMGKPSGICVDWQQRVLVADTHHSRIIVFDEDGRELFR